MKKLHWSTGIVCALLVCAFAQAQLGAAPQNPQLPKAQPLPLSGRSQSGSVVPMQSPSQGGNSVDTVNPSVQVQGSYSGSVTSGKASDQAITLTLQDAVQRGIKFNLGTISAGTATEEARAQRLAAAAELLPDITGSIRETVQQENLAAEGLRLNLPIPGFKFPSIVTFNNVDARARMTETLSLTGYHNWQASRQSARSASFSLRDSRELVALAVSASYLQLIATSARVETSKAQIETAKAVYKQAFDRDQSGLAAHIDVNRSRVELQTQQVRLTSLNNELAKQRIAFARLVGLPMAQAFTLADAVPYHEQALPNLDDLIESAFQHRADVQAAEAQVKAAEAAHRAATSEYLPSFSLNADYGALGVTPTNMMHGTYTVAGGVQFPIFRSGRIRSDVELEDAALKQRKAELEDQKARAEQDVRDAFLDLQTATEQIAVTESNRSLAAETLQQARDRFRAGVADTVELVQAQESVATSEQDYITALFSLNLAQVSLARAVGETEQGIVRLLQGK